MRKYFTILALIILILPSCHCQRGLLFSDLNSDQYIPYFVHFRIPPVSGSRFYPYLSSYHALLSNALRAALLATRALITTETRMIAPRMALCQNGDT